jgi:hypothetical protein
MSTTNNSNSSTPTPSPPPVPPTANVFQTIDFQQELSDEITLEEKIAESVGGHFAAKEVEFADAVSAKIASILHLNVLYARFFAATAVLMFAMMMAVMNAKVSAAAPSS